MAESGSVVCTAMKNAQCARRDGSVISCGLGINESVTITSHDFIAKLSNVCIVGIVRRKSIGVKVGSKIRYAFQFVSTAHEARLTFLNEAHMRTGDADAVLWIHAAKTRLILGEPDENVTGRLLMHLRLTIEKLRIT